MIFNNLWVFGHFLTIPALIASSRGGSDDIFDTFWHLCDFSTFPTTITTFRGKSGQVSSISRHFDEFSKISAVISCFIDVFGEILSIFYTKLWRLFEDLNIDFVFNKWFRWISRQSLKLWTLPDDSEYDYKF